MLYVPNRDAHGGCELGLCLLERDDEPHPAGHALDEQNVLVVRRALLDVFGVADDRGTAVKISLPECVLYAVLPALASVVGRERDVVLDGSRISLEHAVVSLRGLHRCLQRYAPRLHHREKRRHNGQPDCRHVFLTVPQSHDKWIVVYRGGR